MDTSYNIMILVLAGFLLCVLMNPIADASEKKAPEIHTVLPFDQIPAIFKPEFVSADSAEIGPDAPVIGVSLGKESHAYSMVLLNHHEIVNDRVNGHPIATTW